MDAVVTQMNSLTAFLLGFFLNEVIKRWWKIRESCIGALWKSIINLCQICATHLGNSQDDQQCKAIVLRYGLLSHALCYKQAQKVDNDLRDLINMELLNEEEEKILKKLKHKPQVIWIWMTSLFQHLIWESGQINPQLVKNCHDQLFGGRNAIQRTFAFINTQVPLPYAHLNAIAVHFFHFALSIIAGVKCCVALHDGNKGEIALQITLLIGFGFLYQGILIISSKLQNPLGDDDIDFPRMAYHMALQETGEAFFKAAEIHWPILEKIGAKD